MEPGCKEAIVTLMPACAGSCCVPCAYRCPCILILSLPPRCKLPEEPAHTQTPLDVMHTAGAQQLFVGHGLGSRKRGGGGKLHQKQEPILHPQHSPAPWLLPKARPSSALGNKYLYGDNYSIWEENPIKQEPCRAANAGTELEAATPPNACPSAPDNVGAACPHRPTQAPREHRRPCLAASGSMGQLLAQH